MRTLEDIRAFLKDDQFAQEGCGITIDSIGDGTAECSMPLQKRHMNANHVAQGGAVFTLADFCFAAASNAHEEWVTVSQNADIHFLRPGTGNCLYAKATRISQGRTTCLYRVDVTDEKGGLVAMVTLTGFHLPPKRKQP